MIVQILETMQRVYSAFLREVLPLIPFGIGRRFFGQNKGSGGIHDDLKNWYFLLPVMGITTKEEKCFKI